MKYIPGLILIIACFLASEVDGAGSIKNPFAIHPPHRQKIANSLNDISVASPSNPTDSCVEGQIAWDASWIYVCIATNTWKRTAISTWSVTLFNIVLDDGTSKILLDDGSSALIGR